MSARGRVAVAVAVLALAGCAAEPEVVTETVEVPVEVPVEVEVVPQACLDAVELGTATVSGLRDLVDHVDEYGTNPHATYVQESDGDLSGPGMVEYGQEALEELQAITERVHIEEFERAAASCQMASYD